MKVLNSSKAFREHYATKAGNVFCVTTAVAGGGIVASGIVGGSALVAEHAAAAASIWSAGVNLPLFGTFFAGKAAAVGWAAGTAALTSATVVVPAALVGLGVAGGIYCLSRKKRPLQKGTSVQDLAHAFAHIACLPMLALAVSACRANPANTDGVRGYLVREMGAWGYSERYVCAGFEESLRHSPSELCGDYDSKMKKLENGSTQEFGVSSAELPVKAVRAFAEEFRRNFAVCIG